jgi:Xaa-Pro dipeptidase
MNELEAARAQQLRETQTKAENLFHTIETHGLIRSGITEETLNSEIYALAQQMYDITTYWHKRIVRAGRNTLLPYAENPPDLMIEANDILFLDLGPVFEQWEADFGRTFVLGSDPLKQKLCNDVAYAFAEGKRYFHEMPGITGSELYHYVQSLAKNLGWEFGGPMAGHLIGQFPHEKIAGDKVTLYIHPKNHLPIRSLDEHGRQRHWILEIHFIDRAKQIGGFYEELLTIS